MMISQRVKVTVLCRDAKDRLSFTRAWLPVGTSLASAQAAGEALVSVIRPLTDCEVASFSVSFAQRTNDTILPRSKLLSTPLALFVFTLTDIPDTFEQFITPLDPTWLMADGPLAGFAIDLTNSEVVTLTDTIRDGGWVDKFGADMADIYTAYKTEVE
jgi:hypothetical protein